MKKFTSFLFLFLISFGLIAESNNELQNKIQEKQEKFSVIAQLSAKLNILARINSSKLYLKSTAATQKLDSTVNRILNEETQLWQNDYKDEYLYDAEMKNTAWVEKEWNLTDKSWDVISKTELGYDNTDRINSMLLYERDELTHTLKQVSKILIYYNPQGMQDSIIMNSSEDDGATWVIDMKQTNHYNEAKQLIKTEYWGMDEDLGELILSMNVVNTYTASGKIETSNTNVFEEGVQMLWSVTEYNYDSSERLSTIENSAINFLTFTMEKSSRITRQYNESGDLTLEINSSWNGAAWVDDDKTEYQYNLAGDVSAEIFSTWNGVAWIEEWKDEYLFSTTNFSEVTFPQIDFVMNAFSSFLNLLGIQASIDFSYVKAITDIKSFEMVEGSWKNTEHTTFYYSGGTSTNINEFENSVVSVYPNPASESIKFSWKNNHEALSLQIFQITGAKVIEQLVYPGRPVTISHLENGVYLYKLLNGQQNVKTGKMIKK